jgi:pyruvate/2-oxoglutarate dehydrogenase complex dihydrolipoamide acyltransferase (E2) component
METFLIDVPVPSMGATVNELTVISLKIGPGDRVSKGQKIAELESDKSVFEFEAPCDGTLKAIFALAGEVKQAGAPFLRIETSDFSLKHLAVSPAAEAVTTQAKSAPSTSGQLIWTPKALKIAQQAGLATSITDIEATGPGNRVTGDDVTRYLARAK